MAPKRPAYHIAIDSPSELGDRPTGERRGTGLSSKGTASLESPLGAKLREQLGQVIPLVVPAVFVVSSAACSGGGVGT